MFACHYLSSPHAMLALCRELSCFYEGKLFLRGRINSATILCNPASLSNAFAKSVISQNCFRNLTYASNRFAKLAHLQRDAVSAVQFWRFGRRRQFTKRCLHSLASREKRLGVGKPNKQHAPRAASFRRIAKELESQSKERVFAPCSKTTPARHRS